MTPTVGRAMLSPWIVKTKSWLVSTQWIVTDPFGAAPGAPPVNWSQIRATCNWWGPGDTTTVPPGGVCTEYGALGGTDTCSVTVPQAKTSNTAARKAVSPCGTSLKLMSLPGFSAATIRTVIGSGSYHCGG